MSLSAYVTDRRSADLDADQAGVVVGVRVAVPQQVVEPPLQLGRVVRALRRLGAGVQVVEGAWSERSRRSIRPSVYSMRGSPVFSWISPSSYSAWSHRAGCRLTAGSLRAWPSRSRSGGRWPALARRSTWAACRARRRRWRSRCRSGGASRCSARRGAGRGRLPVAARPRSALRWATMPVAASRMGRAGCSAARPVTALGPGRRPAPPAAPGRRCARSVDGLRHQ